MPTWPGSAAALPIRAPSIGAAPKLARRGLAWCATKFSVSYRQRFKFKGLSVTFGDLTAYPCLTLCLSFTTMLKKKQTKYH